MDKIIGGDTLVDREWDNALILLRHSDVESGYAHPAEISLRRALRHNPDIFGRKLLAAVEGVLPPGGASAFIWLVGRLPASEAAASCHAAAWAACCNGDIELREAGIRAFEGWGDPAAVPLLRYRSAVEPRGWLRQYAAQVALDLAE